MEVFNPGTLIGLGSFVVVFVIAPLLAIALAKQTRYKPLYESTSARAIEFERDATFWRAKADEKEKAIQRLDGRVKEIEGLADNRPILEVLRQLAEQSRQLTEQTLDRHSRFATNLEATSKVAFEQFRLSQKLTESLDAHERRAEERNEKIIVALDGIAKRLNGR